MEGQGDPEVAQIVERDEVGVVAGGDRAEAIEPPEARRVEGDEADRDEGIEAPRDRAAQDRVEVAVVEQGRGVAVVRDEGAAVGGGGGDERQERVEVAGGRALADHHGQAAAQLRARLLQPGRFVVGADAGGGVGVERGPDEAGRVAVDRQAAGAGRGELRQHVGVGGEDAGEVHHLAEAGDTGAVERGGDGGRVEDRAARLARRGRDARRHGEEGAQRQIARRRDQRVHAGQAEDVGDLVRVGNDRAGAVRHGDAGELADPELRAFEVDVRVDEGRGEEAPLQVDRLPRVREPAGIGVEPGDPPARHRDRRRLDLAAEDVDDLPAAQHQVGRPPPLRDLDQLAHRRRVHRCLLNPHRLSTPQMTRRRRTLPIAERYPAGASKARSSAPAAWTACRPEDRAPKGAGRRRGPDPDAPVA